MKAVEMEIKLKFLFIGLLLSILSCSHNPYIVDFSKLDNVEGETIVDLSKAVEFTTTSSDIIISDAKYLDRFIDYLITSRRDCELLIQSKHEDRLYLQTQQAIVNKVKSLLIQKGVNPEKLVAKIGFDFGKKFSDKLRKSLIVAVMN